MTSCSMWGMLWPNAKWLLQRAVKGAEICTCIVRIMGEWYLPWAGYEGIADFGAVLSGGDCLTILMTTWKVYGDFTILYLNRPRKWVMIMSLSIRTNDLDWVRENHIMTLLIYKWMQNYDCNSLCTWNFSNIMMKLLCYNNGSPYHTPRAWNKRPTYSMASASASSLSGLQYVSSHGEECTNGN